MNKQDREIFNKYLKILEYNKIPNFIFKYLEVPCLKRLKKVGYFCGMDYASKNIYDFLEEISRFDHSITTALITWNLTKDKYATLSALFHDISSPCFSHAIDYMNKDYSIQESTEEFTEEIIKKDSFLIKLLKEDGIQVEDVIDFKKYSIVDNKRPKLCADRLDGIILTGLYWTKSLNVLDVEKIIKDMIVYTNEVNELEIGFKNYDVANLVYKVNDIIDEFCHSKEDNYMMQLLADITKIAIDNNIIKYSDLYVLDESSLFDILKKSGNVEIMELLNVFENIMIKDIPSVNIPDLKKRKLSLLVDNKRIK